MNPEVGLGPVGTNTDTVPLPWRSVTNAVTIVSF